MQVTSRKILVPLEVTSPTFSSALIASSWTIMNQRLQSTCKYSMPFRYWIQWKRVTAASSAIPCFCATTGCSTTCRSTSGTGGHKCFLCAKKYSTQAHLVRHIKTTHSRVGSFACHLCPSEFSRKDSLHTHIRKNHMQLAKR
ncbi:hypothetical protein MRX96_029717 [Rhipicephalus microplus]